MAGYEDTRQKIISTLMGRPVGTEIQPENHQDYALNMLDYIRSLELIATSTLIGVAESNTTPVQPDSSRVCYIAGVAQNQTVTFENFIGQDGNPISVTTGDMEGVFIILIWNTQYWSAQSFSTNIISQAESSTFYYNYNIKKTYSSVSDMNADKENPIGTDGKYIKVGDIITVVNSTTPSENGVYSYEGSELGWKFQESLNVLISQTSGFNPNILMSQKAIDTQIRNYFNRLFDYLLNNENLIDASKIEDGKYLSDANGSVSSVGSFVGSAISDFIEVKEGKTYKLYSIPSSTNYYSSWFYDSQGNSISKALNVTSTGALVPVGVKFIRHCWLKSTGTGWDINVVKNSNVLRNIVLPQPTSYVPYNTFYLQDDALKQSDYLKDLVNRLSILETEPEPLFSDFQFFFC